MIFTQRLFTLLLGLLFATVLADQVSALYDPGVGRFCSRDPIGFEGSHWNTFELCNSSTLTQVDSTGLDADDLGDYPIDGETLFDEGVGFVTIKDGYGNDMAEIRAGSFYISAVGGCVDGDAIVRSPRVQSAFTKKQKVTLKNLTYLWKCTLNNAQVVARVLKRKDTLLKDHCCYGIDGSEHQLSGDYMFEYDITCENKLTGKKIQMKRKIGNFDWGPLSIGPCPCRIGPMAGLEAPQ